jgi:hypothetical protein
MNSLSRARLFLFLLVMPIGVAQAEEHWLSLGKVDDGSYESLVDISSIRAAGATRRAWVKLIYVPRTQSITGGRWVNYTLTHIAFDCGAQTYRSESVLTYFDGWGDETCAL